MGVYTRPDSPFYWLSLEAAEGRRRRRLCTKIPIGTTPADRRENLALAEAAYSATMGDLARGRFQLPVDRERTTFAKFRVWYYDHVGAKKAGADRERSMLKQLGAYFDRFSLEEITQDRAREWRTWRLKTVVASTVGREQEVLFCVLNAAVPTYLERNVLHGLDWLDTVEHDVRILTHDEEDRLLAAAPTPADRALIICGQDTLARLTNVVELLRDEDHGTYIRFDTKTGIVKVPVSTRLRQALDALPAPPGTRRYFPHLLASTSHRRARRGARAAQCAAIRMFARACADAKIPLGRKRGGVSFHVLRHTGATRMLDAGVDIKTVMEIGGWKSLKQVLRYLHPADPRRVAAVETIGTRASLRLVSSIG